MMLHQKKSEFQMITLAAVPRFIPMKANYEKKGTKMTTQDKRKASTNTRRKLKPNKVTIRDLSPSGKLVRGGGMRFDGKQVDGINLAN
jgi:hypothetical protein